MPKAVIFHLFFRGRWVEDGTEGFGLLRGARALLPAPGPAALLRQRPPRGLRAEEGE